MVPREDVSQNSDLVHIDLKGPRSRMDESYNPARLTNIVTGKRETVLLVDTQDDLVERTLLVDCSRNPELQADLAAALSAFSTIEKRIIFRVLLQGQSVREATKDMSQSSRRWEMWLSDKAIPVLQTILSDYADDLAKIGVYLPSSTGETPVEQCPQTYTAKCKFCAYVAEGCSESLAFAALRTHSNDAHQSTYRKVQAFVHDRDYEIQRDEEQLRETRLPDDFGVEEVI